MRMLNGAVVRRAWKVRSDDKTQHIAVVRSTHPMTQHFTIAAP